MLLNFASLHCDCEQRLQIKDNLTYEEVPIQILDRKDQVLRTKTISLVKVLWKNHTVEEASWEREDEMKSKHQELFINEGVFPDPSCVLNYEPLKIKDNLTYEQVPIQILDRKDQVLCTKSISLVKVLWKNNIVEEASWEREDEMKSKHLELFINEGIMPPKKKRVANSNSEEPIVNLRRPTKARVDTEAEVTQDMRNNERPRVTRTDPLDKAAARLLDRLAHVASRGTSRVKARAGCSFETFMKQNPPSFDGKPNPTEAENWFLQMEKLLEALDCTDSQKVRFATFKLIGEAER